ncbi:MAG: M16 family metallopeptidase [Elusimicrobiota bacterium]
MADQIFKKTVFFFLGSFLFTMNGCTSRFLVSGDRPEYEIIQRREDRITAILPNRLVVIAKRMPAAPVVSAQVRVETGSIYEQEYAGSGLSHFLEHLISGGSTTTRSEEESNEILGRIGAQKNAATGLDSVYYYINAGSKHTSTVIELLSDWMLNSTIPEAEFKREREVIQQEFSMGEGDPGRILWRLTQQARYSAHPARHPIIGYIDEFKNISREQLIDFYNSMYAPNNMVFSVAGDIDPDKVVEHIALLWKDAPSQQLPEISFPIEPEPSAPKFLQARADISRPRIRMAWPGTKLSQEHDYALDLLADILGSGETSRLNQKVRDEKKLVNTVNAYNLSFSWGEGFLGIDAEIADGEQGKEKALEAIKKEIEILSKEKVSLEELERAKRNILSRIENLNQTSQGTASRMAGDILAAGDPDYPRSYLKQIQELSREDLKKAARRYLKEQRLITISLLPETPDHQAKALERPPQEKESDSYPRKTLNLDNRRLLDNLYEFSRREKSKQAETLVGDYKFFELDNGLRLITQRSTLASTLSMQVFMKGGLLAEKPGEEGRSAAAAAMMSRGTENYSAKQLAREIEDLGADINASSGYNTDYISAESLSKDWPRIMELLAEVLLRPTFPRDEWEKTRIRLLAAIDRQSDNWYGELTQHFRKAYFKEHPWSNTRLGKRETILSLTPEKLRHFHQNRLNASQTVIAVTGDAKHEEIKDKVIELFGKMPSKPVETALPRQDSPGKGLKQKETAKPLTAVKMGFGPSVKRVDKDYVKIMLLSNILSDFPSGWLEKALRGEGPGLVYAAWARLVTGLVPGYFEVTFNTSAEAAPEALKRAAATIERAQRETVSQQELQRARSKLLFSEFFNRQSNSERATNAALDELYGIRDPDGMLFRKRVEETTAEEIREAARKYLSRVLTLIMSNQKVDEKEIPPALISGSLNYNE